MRATHQKPKKRRKSLRKETFKATFEGKKTRIHFTLGEKGEPEVKLQKFNPNPNLLKFGTIKVGTKTLKAYAFKNNRKLAFIRINDQFIPLSKFKTRELLSLTMKLGRYLGLLGKKKAKK